MKLLAWCTAILGKLRTATFTTHSHSQGGMAHPIRSVLHAQVGVMHTNYLDYARREENGHIKEALLKCARASRGGGGRGGRKGLLWRLQQRHQHRSLSYTQYGNVCELPTWLHSPLLSSVFIGACLQVHQRLGVPHPLPQGHQAVRRGTAAATAGDHVRARGVALLPQGEWNGRATALGAEATLMCTGARTVGGRGTQLAQCSAGRCRSVSKFPHHAQTSVTMVLLSCAVQVGEHKAQQVETGEPAWPKGAYFLGKVRPSRGGAEEGRKGGGGEEKEGRWRGGKRKADGRRKGIV